MDLQNYKVVYNGERKDTTPYYFPVSVTVSRPFTEVVPPTGENLTIAGFNWNTNEWETIGAVGSAALLSGILSVLFSLKGLPEVEAEQGD